MFGYNLYINKVNEHQEITKYKDDNIESTVYEKCLALQNHMSCILTIFIKPSVDPQAIT